MRTEESLVKEFQELAAVVVSEYTFRYRQALQSDPGLSPDHFLGSVSKEFREKLSGTASGMLLKSGEPDLDLVFCFKKINTVTTESFKAAILKGDLTPITVQPCHPGGQS